MATYTVTLPSGIEWVPKFITNIDPEKCIGCGRCFRVCIRGVLTLVGLDEDGKYVMIDEDDDDEEYERKVMAIGDKDNCIGCEACAQICPRGCYTHEAAEV